MQRETCWRMLKQEGTRDVSKNGECNVDTTVISLAANRNVYVVSIAGEEGMTVQEVADALRAALAHYVHAATGSIPEGMGCRPAKPEDLKPTDTAKVN